MNATLEEHLQAIIAEYLLDNFDIDAIIEKSFNGIVLELIKQKAEEIIYIKMQEIDKKINKINMSVAALSSGINLVCSSHENTIYSEVEKFKDKSND